MDQLPWKKSLELTVKLCRYFNCQEVTQKYLPNLGTEFYREDGAVVGNYYWHCSVTAILDGQIAVEKISWLGKMSNDDICGCGSVHIFAEPLGK